MRVVRAPGMGVVRVPEMGVVRVHGMRVLRVHGTKSWYTIRKILCGTWAHDGHFVFNFIGWTAFGSGL